MNVGEKKSLFLDAVEDAVADLCYHARKSELTVRDVRDLLRKGHVRVSDVTNRVAQTLRGNFDCE